VCARQWNGLLAAQKRTADGQKIAELVEKGVPAVRELYADGGQHASFR
jgi:hypothetical protein